MDKMTQVPWHTETTEQEPEIMRKMPYTMRRLNAGDLILMTQIVSKIGIKELIPCINSPSVLKVVQALGLSKPAEADTNAEADVKKEPDDGIYLVGITVAIQMAEILLQHIGDCKKELFTLLANVTGTSYQEMEEMDAEIFMYLLTDFVRKEEFKSFCNAALRFIK